MGKMNGKINLKPFYLNNDELLGLLVILIAIWVVFYFLPQLIVSLFNTFLGNFIIVLSLLLLYSSNRMYGIVAVLLVITMYRVIHRKEAFTQQSQLQFLKIQHTINKQKIFDMNVIETQASQEELDYFNEHGMWPWSPEVIELYEEAVRNNPYIRTVDKAATVDARKAYNQAAIVRVLTYQSKEGDFLINGVEVDNPHTTLPSGFGSFPYEAGLFDHPTKDIVRCNSNNSGLELVNYSGKGLLTSQSKQVTPVDYKDLESIIPGFKFLGSPCNPCGSLEAIPEYSCQYQLRNDQPPSNIWQYLWS